MSEPTTQAERDQWKRMADAATEGPWTYPAARTSLLRLIADVERLTFDLDACERVMGTTVSERDAARAEVERLTARTVTVEEAARVLYAADGTTVAWDAVSDWLRDHYRHHARALADAGMLNVTPDTQSPDQGASS